MAKLQIEELKLINFATFEDQSVSFEDGFNAIVGETGSGKSLILEALQLVLGSRAHKNFVRKDTEFASVEVSIKANDSSITQFFNSIGHPFNDYITIKRIIFKNGKTKSYLNFMSCPLSTLNLVAKRYFDLVGQFENQKLLSEDYQLILLDNFAGVGRELESYAQVFNQYQVEKKQLQDLIEKSEEMKKRFDYVKFQLDEINSLSPSIEKELLLIEKKESMLIEKNSQDSIIKINHLLSEGDTNIISQIQKIIKILNSHDISNNAQEQASLLLSKAEDLSFFMAQKGISEETEEELVAVIDELDRYQKMKRKFGGTTENIVKNQKLFKAELDEASNLDSKINLASQKISALNISCFQLAQGLSLKRKTAANLLSKMLTETIRNLKMDGATISIELHTDCNVLKTRGIDSASFQAETNPGEGRFPIKQIASGGELSRILLGLRKIISSKDSISIFLFDEIDTGIGGETAICIGKALAEVAKNGQVIAITHLPQIAQYSSKLISVSKMTQKTKGKNRTTSNALIIGDKNKKKFLESMAPLEKFHESAPPPH